MMLYLNTEDTSGKRYTVLRDDFLYKLETGGHGHFLLKKCGKVGKGFIPSGTLVRKPGKKFITIIQNHINNLNK